MAGTSSGIFESVREFNFSNPVAGAASEQIVAFDLTTGAATPQAYEQHDLLGCTAAAALLRAERFDVVLLDLSLPDAAGLQALQHLHSIAPALPIVVLTGLDDEETALRAVQEGAQDFLVKGRVDTPILTRSIRYAIERKRVEEMERQLVKAHAARAEAEVGESRFRGLAEAIPQQRPPPPQGTTTASRSG